MSGHDLFTFPCGEHRKSHFKVKCFCFFFLEKNLIIVAVLDFFFQEKKAFYLEVSFPVLFNPECKQLGPDMVEDKGSRVEVFCSVWGRLGFSTFYHVEIT